MDPPSSASNALDRAGLARQIHDDIMQSLGVAVMHLEICRRLWDRGDLERARQDLDEALASIEAASTALRQILNTLRAPRPASDQA